jgi:hypothetical protein
MLSPSSGFNMKTKAAYYYEMLIYNQRTLKMEAARSLETLVNAKNQNSTPTERTTI